MRKHIEAMKEAIGDGVDLRAYTPWGCIDLISASTGEMKKRYGMIYVDKDNDGKGTLERSCKDSFNWYKKVIASNGEDLNWVKLSLKGLPYNLVWRAFGIETRGYTFLQIEEIERRNEDN